MLLPFFFLLAVDFLLQLTLFLCLFILLLESAAFPFWYVVCPVSVANESLALIALPCLSATHNHMVCELFKLKRLLAETTRFRSTFANLFMLAELSFLGRKSAKLALHRHMFCRFVLLLFFFGDDLPAFLTFVVHARTLDLVHSVFGNINHSFAVVAFLLFRLFFDHSS